jgi:hypothetical protein
VRLETRRGIKGKGTHHNSFSFPFLCTPFPPCRRKSLEWFPRKRLRVAPLIPID